MSGALLDAVGPDDYIVNMADLSFSLPAELQHWVESRVAANAYADAGDYLRALIARDQGQYQEDVRRVRALIQEGIDSGIVDAEPEDILDEIIAEIPGARG